MKDKPKTQQWDKSTNIGQYGVELVKDFLKQCSAGGLWYKTASVIDVQENWEFQALGVDLLWCVNTINSLCCFSVEVKSDLNEKLGNFFFETISNVERDTLGAFLSSKAEWYFYCFVNVPKLYCIPLTEARTWFNKNSSEFREADSRSNKDGSTWMTKGRLVPIPRALKEIDGTRYFTRKRDLWIVSS